MTAKRRTTYCPFWEDEFKYLHKAQNGKYQASCVACNKTFLIDGSGKSQVPYVYPNSLRQGKTIEKSGNLF